MKIVCESEVATGSILHFEANVRAPHRKPAWLHWVTAALCLAALVAVGSYWWPIWYDGRTVRVAAIHNPPFQTIEPDGSSGGAVAELLELAAKNAGIELVWKRVDAGPETVLTHPAQVDLYALMEVRSERNSILHSTDPYARAEMLQVRVEPAGGASPGAPDIPAGADRPRRIAISDQPKSSAWAKARWPDATTIVIFGPSRMEALCRGTVDMALFEAPLLDVVLMRRPRSCRDAQFEIDTVPELHINYAIGSTLESAEVADLLRMEMGKLARANILDAILSRYYPLGHYRSAESFSMTRSEKHATIVNASLLGLAFACIVLWAMVHRLRLRNRSVSQLADLRTRFLTSISHELRTPLNGVIGLASALSSSQLDQAQKECVGLIQTSGETLLRTVNEVLDFSRLEAGKMLLKSEAVEILPLVESTVALVAPMAQSKDLSLYWRVSEEVPQTIASDSSALRQILTNLAGNAVKFTSRGTVMVDVTATRGPAGYTVITIEVIDTGPGIPPDQLEAIFDPFVRSSRRDITSIVGTGLGLTIARQLAILLGGRITARNNPEQGSTFELQFLALSKKGEQTKAEPATAQPSDYQHRTSPGRALVRTRDRKSGEMLVRFLRDSGWNVIATTPEDGIGGNEPGTRFDLLVLEEVDDGDCADQIQRIRETDPGRVIPAVVLCRGVLSEKRLSSTLPPHCTVYQIPFVTELFRVYLERLLEAVESDRAKFTASAGAAASAVAASNASRQSATTAELLSLGNAVKKDAERYGKRCVTCIRQLKGALAPCLARTQQSGLAARALVADDNPVNRKVLSGLLRKLGVEVDIACNGAEAVECFKSRDYRWVILDWQMPVMDGFTAAMHIREWEGKNGAVRTKLIASSASTLEDMIDAVHDAGIDRILPKPVSQESLRHLLAEGVQQCREVHSAPSVERSNLDVFRRTRNDSRGDEAAIRSDAPRRA